MANEFQKRMKRDMQRRLAYRSPGHVNFVPRQSTDSFFIGRVPTAETATDVADYTSTSLPVNEFGHNKPRNFKNKIDEAIYDAEQNFKKK